MTNINIDPIAVTAIVAIFIIIPVTLFNSISKIVASVQRRKIAVECAKQGVAIPEEKAEEPKKVGDVLLVRALAIIGMALGLGLGLIWDEVLLTVALIVGLGGVGMLGGWLIVRPKEQQKK
jgi:hypothetical protein